MKQTLNIQVQLVDGKIESVAVNGKTVEGEMDSIDRNTGNFFRIYESEDGDDVLDVVQWDG